MASKSFRTSVPVSNRTGRPKSDWKQARAAAVFAITLLATGCNQTEEPTGQVVATVNGTEITVAELNEEARSRGVTLAQDPKLRNDLLQELIGRKLLVSEAVSEGFDRSPQYLLAKRRSDEILLAQQYLTSAAQAWTPSKEDVGRYIVSNPHVFDRRALLAVDLVDVPRHVSPAVRQAVITAPSVDAMEVRLAAAGIKGSRAAQSWDTASLPENWRRVLLPLQPGSGFVLPSATGMIVGKITAVTLQPVPASQRAAVAQEALSRERMGMLLKRLVEAKRPSAQIRYHPEFAPGRG